MFTEDRIREIAGKFIGEGDLFVVGVKISAGDEIELTLDSDTSVSIDACADLSRKMNAELETESDDFALTVSSAGIGQPLKCLRQYNKLIGRPVEVILKSGIKILAELRGATEQGITIAYTEKVAVEGKKRREEREVVAGYGFDQIKSTVEHLDFK